MPTTTTPPKTKPRDHRLTWRDWIPAEPGWFGPTDEELITRDELLDRVQELGVKIHPRTLQILENQGLVPRPIRQWHEGAVRALYAPWVVDLAMRAYDRRQGRWPLEKARADVRDAVKRAIFTYGMDRWGGKGIPLDFTKHLVELARRQESITGRPVPVVEVRFLDADDRAVATIRQDVSEMANVLDHLDYKDS
jgi:hypothetical protein